MPGSLSSALCKSRLSRRVLHASAALLLAGLGAGPALAASPGAAALPDAIAADLGYLEALYKDLHRAPELSFQEVETAKRMASELTALGFTVTTGVGGHGVVAVLDNSRGQQDGLKTVLVRADMDGLPVLEKTGLDYASTVTRTDIDGSVVPAMHACGHDIHMTVLIGTARRLVALRDSWRGTLVLIAQPAEERGAGARAMLADGLFERFPKPDHAIALHVSPAQPAGTIGYSEGYALANVDSVDVLVKGIGGHGAYPNTTKDPVVLASQIVMALQTLVSRNIDPQAPAVVTVGAFNGGTKHNVIPDEVKLQLTVRSYSDDVRSQLLDGIRRIAHGQAASAGLPEALWPVVEVKDEYTPSTFNTPPQTRRLAGVWRTLLGDAQVIESPPVMGGEDFGRYYRADNGIGSTIYWLGAVNPETWARATTEGTQLPSLHSALFAPDPQPTIRTGVATMTSGVLELLTPAAQP